MTALSVSYLFLLSPERQALVCQLYEPAKLVMALVRLSASVLVDTILLYTAALHGHGISPGHQPFMPLLGDAMCFCPEDNSVPLFCLAVIVLLLTAL